MNNEPKTSFIPLSETEANELLQLLHLAVKAAGLEIPGAAGAAVHWHKKIKDAFLPHAEPALDKPVE